MKTDTILNRFVREIYVRPWSVPFPFVSSALFDPASCVSETVPFLLSNYRQFGRDIKSIGISIVPPARFDDKYNLFSDDTLGAYDIDSDSVNLRDGTLLDVLTTGFHECCERDLLHSPRHELSECYGSPVDDNTLLRDPSLMDDAHHAACFGQVLLVEKGEQMGRFNGQLRDRTVALMREAPDISFSPVLDYLKDPKQLNAVISRYWP